MISHKLWLKPNGKTDLETPQAISIYYKRSDNFRKQCKTNFKVAPIHWDSKAKRIKPKYLELYPDVQEGLDTIVRSFTKQYKLLNKGEVVIDTVFENLTFKRDLTGSVRGFLKQTNSYSQTSLNSYNDKLNGIEKHIGGQLNINQLGDRTEVLKIKKKLEESSLGNGAASYMKMLRTLAGNFDFDTKRIYKDAIPMQRESLKEGFTSAQIKAGINKIQTVQQLEAYLLWLYSFCLKAMTGNDIPNLDIKSLKFENTQIPLNHYHQLGEYIKSEDPDRPSFYSKVHYGINRGKTGIAASGLYNAFPILFIKDWLRYCIRIAHPQYAYNGDDPIRLYNFKTKDRNGNPIEEGQSKWKSLKDVYYDVYGKLFNGSLHKTRHTYQSCMERLGLNAFEQKRQITHKVDKEALQNYAGSFGIKVKEDLNQLSVIEEFDINKIVKMLAIKFIGAKDIYDKPYADTKINIEFALTSFLMDLKTDKYNWSMREEKMYQKLLDDLKFKGIEEYNRITNEWESREPTENDYEGQLLALHNRKKEYTNKAGIELGKPSKKGSINFKFKIPDWAKEKIEMTPEFEDFIRKNIYQDEKI